MWSKIRRGSWYLPRPSIRGRTVLILIPVHLIAFVLLYFGLVRLMRTEMLRTHSSGARVMLVEAVHTLHPMMCSRDHAVGPVTTGDFVRRHSLLDLRIYRSDGSLMGQPGHPVQKMKTFLEGDQEEVFAFVDHGEVKALTGMLRIRSEGDCTQCHRPGTTLGAASMDMDLTPEMTAAHSRLEWSLGYLVIGWALAVGFVNVGISAWTRRSLAHVRRLEAHATTGTMDGAPKPGAFLDPVAAELYQSLTRVLQHQQKEKDEVNLRLHHTERLASLGRLAAGLAHEIKNPLAGIRGVMELMRDDTEEAEQQELFVQIVKELDRVNDIIKLLLNFARPASPKKSEVDVARLLDESLQFLRPGLSKKSITLCIEISRDVGSFWLDPTMIRHVMTNLVANAGDAIGEFGSIVVRASGFPEGGGLIISVEDDGPGIPEARLDEIFEPFFTTKFTGTGLGLAVVRSMVTQHGGRVEVDSEPGRGTTFFVILPERGAADEPEEPEPYEEG